MNPLPTRPQQQGFLSNDLVRSLDAVVDRLNACSGDDTSSVYALLVSTDRGVPLARSFGTNSTEAEFHAQMNEESLHALETLWAANVSPPLPSGAMGGIDVDKPNHPLLRHLGMGSSVNTATAFYETCTLLHIYQHHMVITILMSPTANVGTIKSVIMPLLKVLLEPVQSILSKGRSELETSEY
jgi:hypothetical protein